MINSGYGSRNDFLSVRDPGKVPNLTGSGKESQFLINYLFLFCLDPDQDPGKSSKPNRIRIDNTGKPYWDAWNASTERVGSGLFHEKSSLFSPPGGFGKSYDFSGPSCCCIGWINPRIRSNHSSSLFVTIFLLHNFPVTHFSAKTKYL